MEVGLDRLEPFDLMLNSARDILDDKAFLSLHKACWSGVAGLITLAGAAMQRTQTR